MARSPACSGDLFTSLRASGALALLGRRGVKAVEVHSLEDNLAARPADPVFLGEEEDGGGTGAALLIGRSGTMFCVVHEC